MNPAFRQIGNAVPPLLGFAVARKVMAALQNATAFRQQEQPRALALAG
jgi:hypothetical protein